MALRFTLSLILLGASAISSSGDTALFQPTAGMALGRLEAKESTLSITPSTTLEVTIGEAKFWPGVTIPAPGSGWDLSACGRITIEVRNPGRKELLIHGRIDTRNAKGDSPWHTGVARIGAHESGTLTVPLPRHRQDKLDGRLFGLRGYPVTRQGDESVNSEQAVRLLIFLPKGTGNRRFEIGRIAAGGKPVPVTASVDDADPYFPFVDPFGQYKHRDWPGKIKSIDELRVRHRREEAALSKDGGPAGWSRYGGWADGPKLEARGGFRPAKHMGKWWLVDPEGYLFFSHGVDCVGSDDRTVIDGRETWFDAFPGREPAFSGFTYGGTPLKGHYAGKRSQCFSFARTNLKRKYGEDWQARDAEMIQKRLRSWGLNTIGNWSDPRVFLLRRTPYTDTLGTHGARIIAASTGYWHPFPDPFAPGFTDGLRKRLKGVAKRAADDPWCLGFYVDNELSWGKPRELALATLASPADQPAKSAFLADLRKRYSTIDKLNAAWGTTHPSWQAVLKHTGKPDPQRAGADLDAFCVRLSEEYFRRVRDAVKAAAPGRLYLGCRFSNFNPAATEAAAKFCDVVSFNRYKRGLENFDFQVGDKPVIIGEFHFGALDRGMFHTGLVPVENQAARAAAYRSYVRSALKHPLVVGTHWFKWRDEPVTGRVHDEENYQIGFVDVADTPYPETVAAIRTIGDHLYSIRTGTAAGNAPTP